MKATLLAFFIALAIFSMPETGWSARAETKIVTRIDKVTAVMKGGTLTVHVEGMARTPSLLGRGGELVRRGQGPNKDGLLEYELVFNPPQMNYTGDKLKPVKTTLKVSSIPPGTKGVRIYAEFNEMNSILPESKQASAATKKKEFLQTEEPVVAKKEKPETKKEELAPKKAEQEKTSQWWNPFHRKPTAAQVNTAPPTPPKKPEVALKKKEPVVKKEEPIVAKKEKPTRKPEVVKEEKKNRGWNWNPFHRKAAVEQVSAPSPPPTKKEVPVLKKKEPVVKKEEVVLKQEETVPPKKEEKKKRSWNLNPFHRQPAQPQANATPAPKKPELEIKKKGPAVREEESFAVKKENPISKKEAEQLKKEEAAAPVQEKKKRGWNLNPFHRKSPTPTPAPKKEETIVKKKEPAVTKEKPAPKKEETEKKKKDHWYWNPFQHKSDASQNNDESPR